MRAVRIVLLHILPGMGLPGDRATFTELADPVAADREARGGPL